MSQGRAPTVQSGHKVEPQGKAVNPGWVSQLGNAVGPARAVEPMYEGKVGPKAPMMREETHPCGSQGKHR